MRLASVIPFSLLTPNTERVNVTLDDGATMLVTLGATAKLNNQQVQARSALGANPHSRTRADDDPECLVEPVNLIDTKTVEELKLNDAVFVRLSSLIRLFTDLLVAAVLLRLLRPLPRPVSTDRLRYLLCAMLRAAQPLLRTDSVGSRVERRLRGAGRSKRRQSTE